MILKKNIGFNLLEIMIVIAILASIVTLATVKYNEYTIKAGMISVANYSKTIQDKLVLYYNNHDRLPNTIQAAAFLTTGLPADVRDFVVGEPTYYDGFNEDNSTLNLDNMPIEIQTALELDLGGLTQIEDLVYLIYTLDPTCRTTGNPAMYVSVSVKKTGQDLTTINYSTGVKPSCVVPNSSFICREGYICNPSGEPDPNTCADGYLRTGTVCNLCPLGAVCSGGAITWL